MIKICPPFFYYFPSVRDDNLMCNLIYFDSRARVLFILLRPNFARASVGICVREHWDLAQLHTNVASEFAHYLCARGAAPAEARAHARLAPRSCAHKSLARFAARRPTQSHRAGPVTTLLAANIFGLVNSERVTPTAPAIGVRHPLLAARRPAPPISLRLFRHLCEHV